MSDKHNSIDDAHTSTNAVSDTAPLHVVVVEPFSGRRERIAKGLYVQWHYRQGGEVGHSTRCEWEPAVPRALSRQMRRAYEGARARFMQELATRMGGANMVWELSGDGSLMYGGVHEPAKAGRA